MQCVYLWNLLWMINYCVLTVQLVFLCSVVDWALCLFYKFNCWVNRYFEEGKKNGPAHQSDKYWTVPENKCSKNATDLFQNSSWTYDRGLNNIERSLMCSGFRFICCVVNSVTVGCRIYNDSTNRCKWTTTFPGRLHTFGRSDLSKSTPNSYAIYNTTNKPKTRTHEGPFNIYREKMYVPSSWEI
jgi:hypothetical protein